MSESNASTPPSGPGASILDHSFRSPALPWLATLIACLAAALIALPHGLYPSWLPAFWLPSGVAVAAAAIFDRRVLGSIFLAGLASWLLAVPAGTAGSTGVFLASAVVAGLALSTQAAVGEWALQRWTRSGNRFDRPVDFFRFHFLIGPVSCFPGTLVLVAGFLLCGWISPGAALHVGLTSFLASITGALAVAPLLIFLSGRLPAPWIRTPSAWGTLLVAAGGACLALAYTAHTVKTKWSSSMDGDATDAVAELQRRVELHSRDVKNLHSFWESCQNVSREEFHTFMKSALEHSSFRMLGWSLDVSTPSPDSPAGTVPVYRASLPIRYVAPREKEAEFLGRDLMAQPALAAAVEKARSSNALTASAPFAWNGKPPCFVLAVWIPAHRPALPLPNPDAEAGLPDSPGVVFGVLDCARLLDAAFASSGSWTGAVRVLDVPGPSSALEFGSRQPAEPGMAFRGSGQSGQLVKRFQVADRTWHLIFEPPIEPWRRLFITEIWMLQVAAITVTSLIGALVISVGERTATIETTVRDRTGELTKSNQRFQQLAESIPEAFWIMEVDPWRFLYISPAWERILGRKTEDLLAYPRAWIDCVHPDDRDAIQSHLISPPPEGFHLEYRIRKPDGQTRYVRNRAFPLQGSDRSGNGFAGLIGDITDRRMRDAELSEARRAAEAATQELKQLFEVSLDMLCLAGTDGYFKQVNPAFSATLGHSEATLLATPFLDFVHPDDRENTLAAIRHLEEGRTVISFQNRYRNAAGEYLWIEWNAVPGAGGSCIYAAARNVSQRKNMELELRRSNQDLEQFAYVASHDLREPLRVVTSFVQLLAKRYRGNLGGEADEYIGYVVDGVERMRRLIDGLLQLSRVQTRGQESSAIDSNQSLDAALGNLRLMISETRATVTSDPLPRVMADSLQVTQLFQNLIANAMRFRHPDREPAIQISATRVEAFQQFTVRDNGRGIDPQHFERIFRIFQRLDPSGEGDGTGIGLAICQRIARRHGGSIWVESRPNEGSAFHFTLPMMTEPKSTGEAAG